MKTNNDFKLISHDEQIPLLTAIGEVIDKFQLDELSYNVGHNDMFFQQGESLEITMTLFDKNAIKKVLSTFNQMS